MSTGTQALVRLGYEQITSLSSATGLTVPAGASLALVTPASKSVRWRDDGTNPSSTVGYPLNVGDELQYDAANLGAIKFIETAASATLDVVYYGQK